LTLFLSLRRVLQPSSTLFFRRSSFLLLSTFVFIVR
jgi:hypothetical protein